MKFSLFLTLSVVPLFCVATEPVDLRIEDAKSAVSSLLKDPESARFQNVKVIENSKGATSIVGEVNGRNSYGGYVGFKPFVVSDRYTGIVNDGDSLRQYRIAGGDGPKGELEARLEDEAMFNSQVIWTLLENVIIENHSPDEAVSAALVAIRNRAKSNGGEVSDELAKLISQQYLDTIQKTMSDKNQVAAIKRNPEYQKSMFIPVLYASTLTQLRAQMGLNK